MKRVVYLLVILTLVMISIDAYAATTGINKQPRSGPIRLVCLNPDGLQKHVRDLTRNQIIGVRHAARAGEIKWPCDDVQLRVGTKVIHERWLQTEDGWWVLGQTIQYPNGSVVVTVDPLQATYHLQPLQFKRFYPNFYVPQQPGRVHTYPQSHRDGVSGMTVEEGQEFLRRQLGLPPK
jgi:hypothetical protein